MDDEYKKILNRISANVDENNEILNSIRNEKRVSRLISFFYWIVIIIAGLFAWSYISPAIENVKKFVDSIIQTKDDVEVFVDSVEKIIPKK